MVNKTALLLGMILEILLKTFIEIDYLATETLNVKPIERYHERAVTDVVSADKHMHTVDSRLSYSIQKSLRTLSSSTCHAMPCLSVVLTRTFFPNRQNRMLHFVQ